MECALVLVIFVVVAVAAVVVSNRRTEPSRVLMASEPPPPSRPAVSAPLRPAPQSIPVATPASTRPATPPKPARRARASDGDRFWVPAGESARVGGRDLGGMLYVGSGLQPMAQSYRGNGEPALINPNLPVSWRNADHDGRLMGYWPFYSGIQPASRAAYLEWLARGRQGPTYIGYVFLFFYGIERRVLVDAQTSEQARAEVDGALAEVERLLSLYGDNRSFHGYATSFLSSVRLLYRPIDPMAFEPPRTRQGFQVPLTLRIALGAFAAEGRPVPPEWAWSWVINAPETRLRTPAQRCPEEFESLFKIRYAERFRKGGLEVKPGKTTLRAGYHPASPSFVGHISIPLPGLPDVAGLSAPLRKLQEVVDSTLQELDVYSRWVGRTGDPNSLVAVSLLPPELAKDRGGEEVDRLTGWIEAGMAGGASCRVPGEDLAARWPCQTEGKLARRDAEMLATFLEQRGYGMEPDARFGGPPPGSGGAVLFRLPDGAAGEPGDAYRAAAVLLHLAVAVAAVDGDVSETEERHLLEHLEGALHLSAAERARLEACLEGLVAEPPGLSGLKKKVAPLDPEQRRAIGRFLITVAGADGHVGAEEIKLLTRIYTLLGLETQAVYSDVHSLASADAPPLEPVTVRPAEPGAGGFAIPPAPSPAGITLDPRKIASRREETQAVAGILEEIFREEEPAAIAPRPLPEERDAVDTPAEAALAGLDGPHSAFLRRLAEKTVWEKTDVERLAAGFGLLPEGALEVLNEAAYERCGAPLLEGDETLEIDTQVLEEVLT